MNIASKIIRPWRWFRFSLKTLLVAVTIFALPLGWKIEQVRRQRSAIETLESRKEIFITYDYQRESLEWGPCSNGPPPVPSPLSKWFGKDWVQHVARISCSNVASDDSLTYLKDIGPADELVLFGRYVTDKGLQTAVAYQPKLRMVWITCNKITASGIFCLSDLKDLELLRIDLRVNQRLHNAPVLDVLRKRGVKIQLDE